VILVLSPRLQGLRGPAMGCLAALCFGAGAAPATRLDIAPMLIAERTLPNGLRVVAVENHASPTVSVQVWYHVGSKDDPPGRSGFAHLFEHLMFKSTRHMKNEQFDRLTEDVGGANNAFTSDDVTAYHEVVPSNHLETLLWAEAERMANLNVDEANFKSERAVVQEEYRQSVLAAPYGRFFNAIAPSSYRVHSYQRPTIGNIEELDAATLADVLAFHRSYYRPDHATLVVTGDFEPRQLDAWVERYFTPVARPATPVAAVSALEPAWTSDRSVLVSGPKVPLPALALTWLAPPVTHPDTAALRVAAALLSAGESSRLNHSLVYRQQLASQAGFEADLKAGPGLLIAFAIAADRKPLARVKAALEAEVRRLARTPVSAQELAKVKTQLLTRALVARETASGQGMALGEAAVLEGGAARANQGLIELQQVSAADVQRVVKRYTQGAHKVSIEYRQTEVAP
jgi:zinc protease